MKPHYTPTFNVLRDLLIRLFGDQQPKEINETAEMLTSELKAAGESGLLSVERTDRIAAHLRELFLPNGA